MMQTAVPKDRQATHNAVLGLIAQTIVFACLMGVAYWAKSDVCFAAARFVAPGLLIWLSLILVFKQVQRVNAEALEAEELRRARTSGADPALFEIDEEALHIERRKFAGLIRWLLPGATLVLALVGILGSFIYWKWPFASVPAADVFHRTQNPLRCVWFVVAAGLICHFFRAHAIGLARQREWSLMRAGAAYMAGCSIVCAIAMLGMVVSERSFPWVEPLAAQVIRFLMFLLGIEFLGNFIADFYRPRTPGVVPRPAFDSRLLGLVTEPGGIAKSIADAINYQFGFEVSKTWFYQLLAATVLPLTLVTMLFVVLLSSVVIIDADEAAVIERFGRRVHAEGEQLGPGFHWKLPWPIERVQRAPVKRLSTLVVGDAPTEPAKSEETGREKAVLWTEEHKFQAEMLLIVGHSSNVENLPKPADESEAEKGKSVAVNAVMASVPIRYHITDLHKYLYSYEEPDRVLESLAFRKLSESASRVDLETLMGPGRQAFNEELKKGLQAEIDAFGLGIKVVFCGIESLHPPNEAGVAKAFQDVIAAEGKKLDAIHTAEGEAEQILTAVAGSVARATLVDEAIQAREVLAKQPDADPKALADAEARVERLLMGDPVKGLAPIGGDSAVRLSMARLRAQQRLTDAAAKASAFPSEVAAYKASPGLYQVRKVLEVLEGLDGVRKFLIVGDPSNFLLEYENVEPTRIDLGEKN